MAHKKRSHRSRKYRKPISQHLSEMSPKEDTEKEFADKKQHSGKVERKPIPQIAGGEGEKEKWWKAVTKSKTTSGTTVAPTTDTGTDSGTDSD